jgi:uncharacterized protein with FMN-binding domain
MVTSVTLLVLITFLVMGAKTFARHSNTTSTPAQATTVATKPASSTPATSATNGTYKDGSYMATGSYNSPGGTQKVLVNLTIANGAVSDATAQGQAKDGVAMIYQSDFSSGFKQFVVGKKLDTIHLSRVSGSSLTSQGFNSALKQIESQAKS